MTRCDPGASLEGAPLLYCDGKEWNGTIPECHGNRNVDFTSRKTLITVPPTPPFLQLSVEGVESSTVKSGSRVLVKCQSTGGWLTVNKYTH